jgi:hypothetical protein
MLNYFFNLEKKLNEIFDNFLRKKIAPNAKKFPTKKKKKKHSSAPFPSHNVSSLKSWSFEF